MSEFLIRDGWTGNETWITAASAREACILHENAARARPDRHPCRPADVLSLSAPANHQSLDRPDLIDVRIADSSCVGLPANVRRDAGSV